MLEIIINYNSLGQDAVLEEEDLETQAWLEELFVLHLSISFLAWAFFSCVAGLRCPSAVREAEQGAIRNLM